MPIIKIENRERVNGSVMAIPGTALNLPDESGEHDTVLGIVEIDMSQIRQDNLVQELALRGQFLKKYGRVNDQRRIQLGPNGAGEQQLGKNKWLCVQLHKPIRTSHRPTPKDCLEEDRGSRYFVPSLW